MKVKHGLIIASLSLVAMTFGLVIFLRSERPPLSLFTRAEPSGSLLPRIDGPLPNAEQVSLAEAQARLQYSISLPESQQIQQVWVSTTAVDPANRSVAVRFGEGLLLIIHPMEQSPNWDSIIVTAPLFRKITVNGNPGMGIAPGNTEVNGRQFLHPGSVEWWVDGLDITLYSDTLPLEVLLNIAQTIH